MAQRDEQLARLVENVQASARYREISADLVRNIGARELSKRGSFKEAVKATKNKLHQVGGAYLSEQQAYATWLRDLQELVQARKEDELRVYLRTIMTHHASTRERLPILEEFYRTILAELPPVHSVLDLACGLNPLALPWMPLAQPVEYYACDMYTGMIDFLQRCLPLLGARGEAVVCDVLQSCPARQVDVAFVLKTLPCLEQVEKTVGSRLLRGINASAIVVSFPMHSLGGRAKGMQAHYASTFARLVEQTSWSSQSFTFATELAFLLTRKDVPPG